MNHARTIVGLFTLIVSLAAPGCGKEEEPARAFDETGAWSMTFYSLDGGASNKLDPLQREHAFMLQFDRDNRVVTTAACIDETNGLISPADAPCETSPEETDWVCTCWGYAFEGEMMKWVRFEAGSQPPAVSFDDGGSNTPPPGGDEAGETGTGGGDEAGVPSGDATITAVAHAEKSSTITLARLPVGLFGSDGMASRFEFVAVKASLFRRAFEDTERGTCTPCIP